MMLQNLDMDYAKKMQRCHEYVEALEVEQKKIQVFQRELPLCLELVTQAIQACRKELSSTSTTSDQIIHGGAQSECSEQTTSVCGGPVFEEFIPTKKSEEEDGEHESPSPRPDDDQNNDKKKSDWLRSVQLWNPSPDPNPTKDVVSITTERVVKKAKVVEVKPNCGAFQPFQKDKKRVLETDLQHQPPVKKVATSAPATTTSSTTETGGAKSDPEQIQPQQQQSESQTQTQTHRKQRRCWSPELHRRFLHALQQLGGSHVATPKQIRDHMKVDGLTNDEVKSHLQKYRLHTRRPATSVTAQSNVNPQQPQFVVVGGIWVPSPQDYPPPTHVVTDNNNNNNTVYAPVAAQPPQSPKDSVERSSGGRCNSPAASSSTNATTTSSPVS